MRDQVDILFNHINQMDAYINITIESSHSEGKHPLPRHQVLPQL